MPEVPIIKPINITDYEFKQSKYEHVPKLPFRSIIVASSTGGKTVLIQYLILNVYKNCFSRIFIISPSVQNDPTFVEVKKYQREEMKVDDTKEQVYFDEYRPEELESIINTQRKIINYMKNTKMKKLYIQFLLLLMTTPMILNLLDIVNYYTVYLQEVGTTPLVLFVQLKNTMC